MTLRKRFFSRLLSSGPRPPLPRGRRRLAVEHLEDRITPSGGEIHGTIWNDANGDGIHAAGGGEPGLANRVVYLDQNQNGQLDASEMSTTTATDGSYAFTNLAPGTYYVAEALPPGWVQTTPTTAERTVTLTSSTPYTFTFNNFASTTDQQIPTYHENGYTFDTTFNPSPSFPYEFYIWGSSDTARYAGHPALDAEWSPVTISLTHDNGVPFSMTSIDLSTIWNSVYFPTVTFTGTHSDGTTVQQSFNLSNQLGFHTFVFNGFTNLTSLKWNSTGTSDYHQFTNVVVGTGGGTQIATGMDFGTLQAAAPNVTVGDVSQQQSVSAGTSCFFPVQLSSSYQYPVTVYYSTADGTATAGSDYTAASGSIVFSPGQTQRTIIVPVYNDPIYEPDETFFLNLTSAVNGTITRAQGTGTIISSSTLSAANDAYSVNENNTLSVTAPGVLANDTAVNGNPMTPSLVSGPSHGSLTLNADGSFTYTPATNYSGSDSFTYQDTQGNLTSNTATVNLTVNSVNQPPTAVNDSYTLNEDTTLNVAALAGTSTLTMNSQPGDWVGAGRTYSFSSATGTFGVYGGINLLDFSYQDHNPNEWWYLDFQAPQGSALTPGSYPNAQRAGFGPANLPGMDIFGDGRGSNTLTGNFTVLQSSFSPSGQVQHFDIQFVQHSEGATPALTGELNYYASTTPPGVLANDTDPEQQTLTAILVSGPAHGTLTLNADGSFVYTPAPNFNGVDSFTYMANDGSLNSNVATVTLTVNPVNDAPSFTAGGNQSVPASSGPQTVANWATAISAGPPDEANQALNFLVTTNNANLFAAAPAIDPTTGTLTYTPATGV
jgi:VCBS repeat-containing protein